jgi:hypothetical protein
MYFHKIKYMLAAFTVLIVLMGLFFLAPTLMGTEAVTPGGNVLIGSIPPDDGWASFVDKDSGEEYQFRLIASEWENPGVGQATFLLEGPSISMCTANGDQANIEFEDPGGDYYGHHYPGNNPLNAINCGTAYVMAVSVNGCQADIEYHGYVHSDYPLVTYMGMMTTDVNLKIGGKSGNNSINIQVYTPKKVIKLKGKFSGYYEMDTCP